MKVFQCGHCNFPLFFENNSCENCGHLSGYSDLDRQMLTFDPAGYSLISDVGQLEYKYCKNEQYGVCNWLLPKNSIQEFCHACQFNRTIANLSVDKNFENWRHLEVAKHRLIYQIQKLGFNLPSKLINEEGLCFDFIANNDDPNIMTGHSDGVITILIKEADSTFREQARKELHEPYRTLIGHMRHEVGHYFWNLLILSDANALQTFRTIFGNEESNYNNALQTYYQHGAPNNWQHSFISKYATSHPWEDWAETWAHYLHIMDMVETAHFFGLEVNDKTISESMRIAATFDPYTIYDFETIVRICIPISYAVNSINRAMGLSDVYPFVITTTVKNKMKFIHDLLWSKRNR